MGEDRKRRGENTRSALFCHIAGRTFAELRKKCAEELIGLDFDGYGIGGLSIGEPKEVMNEVLMSSVPLVPQDKPAISWRGLAG